MKFKTKLLIALLFALLHRSGFAQQNLSLAWAGHLGDGRSKDIAIEGSARDAAGMTYVAGRFTGAVDFDPGPGEATHNSLTNENGIEAACFVAKYDQSGGLAWVKVIPGDIHVQGMALQGSQGIAMCLAFYGSIDVDPGPAEVKIGAPQNMCLLGLDPDGEYAWAKGIAHQSTDWMDLQCDPAGNVFVVGNYYHAFDCDPSPGVHLLPRSPKPLGYGQDPFVIKYDPAGNLIWAHTMVGLTGIVKTEAVQIASDGSVIVAGNYLGQVDFDDSPTQALVPAAAANGMGNFIARFGQDGQVKRVRLLPSAYEHFVRDMAPDPDGGVWVAGVFSTNIDLGGPAPFTSTGLDGYLAHYDSLGDHQWSIQLGGSGDLQLRALAWDGDQGLYLGGSFVGGNDLDPSAAYQVPMSNGLSDAFLARYDLSGALQWAYSWGDTAEDACLELQADAQAGVTAMSQFIGLVDFQRGPGSSTSYHPGSPGLGISQHDGQGTFAWASASEARLGGDDVTKAISSDPAGNALIAGEFRGVVDLDAGSGQVKVAARGTSDIFLALHNAQGQYVWGHALGGPGLDVVKDAFTDHVGNHYLLGSYQDSIDLDPSQAGAELAPPPLSNYNGMFFLAKYGPAGNLIFAENLFSSNSYLTDAAMDSLGNLCVLGMIYDGEDLDPDPVQQLVLPASLFIPNHFTMRLDANGDLVWAKSLTSADQYNLSQIAWDPTGGFLVSGDVWPSFVYPGGDIDPDPVHVVWVLPSDGTFFAHYDDNGNYEHVIKTSASGMRVDGLKVDASGSYWITGNVPFLYDFDAGTPIVHLPGHIDSGFLARYTASGNLSFVKQVPRFDNYDRGNLALRADGLAVVAGWYSGSAYLYDAAGTQVAADLYDPYASSKKEIKAAHWAHNGQLLLGGAYNQPFAADRLTQGQVLPNAGDDDAFWTSYHLCAPAAVAFSLSQTSFCFDDPAFTLSAGSPAGGVLSGPGVAGGTFTPGLAGIGDFELFYAVTDLQGCRSAASVTVQVSACTSAPDPSPKAAFQLHPNPSTGRLALTASDWQGAHLDLQLYNAWGQQVHSARLREGDAELQLDHLAAGIYVAALSGKAGKATLRWVKLD